MPERIIEERFEQLGSKVQRATSELEADRAAREKARAEDALLRQAEEDSREWLRKFALGALIAAVIGLGVAVFALAVARDARHVLAETRINSCHSYNTETVPAVNALNDRNQELLRSIAGQSTNPATTEFVDQQVALYEAEKALYRDCSPSGLDAFSNGTGGFLPRGEEP